MRFSLRSAPIALALLLGCSAPAFADVSISFSVPGTRIGVNLGGYPTLQRIPGYPVYYAPGVNTNYFFYDGMYWVYEGDNWYASSWYNGPWGLVDRYEVPPYILRVPVRYYRHAPVYFRGWRADAPPRWGDHWGSSWQQRRSGWDRWDRKSSPAPAPLPTYQREYRGNRYPDASRQGELQNRNYRFQPRERIAQEHYQERRTYNQNSRPEPQQRRDDRGQARQEPQQRRDQQRQEPQQRQAPQRQEPQQRQAPQRQEPQARPQPQPQERDSRERNETIQQRNERLGSGG